MEDDTGVAGTPKSCIAAPSGKPRQQTDELVVLESRVLPEPSSPEQLLRERLCLRATGAPQAGRRERRVALSRQSARTAGCLLSVPHGAATPSPAEPEEAADGTSFSEADKKREDPSPSLLLRSGAIPRDEAQRVLQLQRAAVRRAIHDQQDATESEGPREFHIGPKRLLIPHTNILPLNVQLLLDKAAAGSPVGGVRASSRHKNIRKVVTSSFAASHRDQPTPVHAGASTYNNIASAYDAGKDGVSAQDLHFGAEGGALNRSVAVHEGHSTTEDTHSSQEEEAARLKNALENAKNITPQDFLDLIFSYQSLSEEFCYLNRTGPYSYEIVPFPQKNPHDYLTLSARGVTHFTKDGDTEFLTLRGWEREQRIYWKITSIPFFANYHKWLMISIWKGVMRKSRFKNCETILQKNLFILNNTLRKALLLIRSYGLKTAAWNILALHPDVVYTLENFLHVQATRRQQLAGDLKKVRAAIVHELSRACEASLQEFLESNGFSVGRSSALCRHRDSRPTSASGANSAGSPHSLWRSEAPSGSAGRQPGTSPPLVRSPSGASPRQQQQQQQLEQQRKLFLAPAPSSALAAGRSLASYTEKATTRLQCKKLAKFVKVAEYLLIDALMNFACESTSRFLQALEKYLLTKEGGTERKDGDIDVAAVAGGEGKGMNSKLSGEAKNTRAVTTGGTASRAPAAAPLLNNQKPAFLIQLDLDATSLCLIPDKLTFRTTVETSLLEAFKVVAAMPRLLRAPEIAAYTLTAQQQYEEDLPEESDLLFSSFFPTEDTTFLSLIRQTGKTVERLFERVLVAADESSHLVKLYNECEATTVNSFDESDLSTYEAALARCRDNTQELSKTPPQLPLGLFYLDTTRMQKRLLPSLKRVSTIVQNLLPAKSSKAFTGLLQVSLQLAGRSMSTLLQQIKAATAKLSEVPCDIDSYVQFNSYLQQVRGQLFATYEGQCAYISEIFDIIKKYSLKVEGALKHQSVELAQALNTLRTQIQFAVYSSETNTQRFHKELATAVPALERKISSYLSQLEMEMFVEDSCDLDEVIAVLGCMQQDVQAVAAEVERCKRRTITAGMSPAHYYTRRCQEFLRKEVLPFENFEELQRRFEALQLLFTSKKAWKQLRDAWGQQKFATVDVKVIQSEVQTYVRLSSRLQRQLAANEAFVNFKGAVDRFRSFLPVVLALRNPALQQRHWEKIYTYFSSELDLQNPELLLNDLLAVDVSAFANDILQVSSDATVEEALQKMFEGVQSTWATLQLPLTTYKATKDKVTILGNLEEISVALDDSIVTMATIAGSRAADPIRESVEAQQAKLALLQESLEEWQTLQKSWIYLESIFSASDIRKQLPSEAARFAVVDQEWRGVMKDALEYSVAMSAGTSEGRLESFRRMNRVLEDIRKGLEDYLQHKREAFPRFFFLSNDELLELLSQAKKLSVIQPLIRKCFDNVYHLRLQEESKLSEITGVMSAEGEVLPFYKPLKARGSVEKWLPDVEDIMKKTVLRLIKAQRSEYAVPSLREWIATQPSQVVTCVSQMLWVATTEQALTSQDVRAALSMHYKGIMELLQEVLDIVRDCLPPLRRRVVSALSIQALHNRDVIDDLLSAGVESINSFGWQQQLRHYWDLEKDTCTVAQLDSIFPYGGEYLGAPARLVITPLTDRCWLTITSALSLMKLSCNIAGPAGAGKTESVKELARMLGYFCLVFNCSETVDLYILEKVFAGVVTASGCWTCLDEFNRLDINVLSVVAQQLLMIRHALLHEQQQQELQQVELQTQQIVVQQDSSQQPTDPQQQPSNKSAAVTSSSSTTPAGATSSSASFGPPTSSSFSSSPTAAGGASGQSAAMSSSTTSGATAATNKTRTPVGSTAAGGGLGSEALSRMEKDSFLSASRLLRIKPTCGIFITMNPGYAGRTELPENLKQLFRPVAMIVPDYASIAEILLVAEGFASAKTLAEKFIKFYRLLSTQLSQQRHYDFGLRSVKAVLLLAGELRRQKPLEDEEDLLIEATCELNEAKFLEEDVTLFHSIICDFFPSYQGARQCCDEEFRETVYQVMTERGLQPTTTGVAAVSSVYRMLSSRVGVMLLGPPMSGKSSALLVLADTLDALHRQGYFRRRALQQQKQQQRYSRYKSSATAGRSARNSCQGSSRPSKNSLCLRALGSSSQQQLEGTSAGASANKKEITESDDEAKRHSRSSGRGSSGTSSGGITTNSPGSKRQSKAVEDYTAAGEGRPQATEEKKSNATRSRETVAAKVLASLSNIDAVGGSGDGGGDGGQTGSGEGSAGAEAEGGDEDRHKEGEQNEDAGDDEEDESDEEEDDDMELEEIGEEVAPIIVPGDAAATAGGDNASSAAVTYRVINPKAISIAELFGEFTALTQEWKDGVASKAIREFAADTTSNTSFKWLIFDGPVDSLWVESMNSVLDDNQMLCLPNGERIKLRPEMRLVLEVIDLSAASPATVSRCGMVYFSSKAITWNSLVRGWIDRLPQRIFSEKLKEQLLQLFKCAIPPALALYESKRLQWEIATPPTALVQAVCNILQAVLHIPLDASSEKRCEATTDSDETDASAGVRERSGSRERLLTMCSSEGDSSITEAPLHSLLEHLLPEQLETLLLPAFVFSFIWGFGGGLKGPSAAYFSRFVEELFQDKIILPRGEVYDLSLNFSSCFGKRYLETERSLLLSAGSSSSGSYEALAESGGSGVQQDNTASAAGAAAGLAHNISSNSKEDKDEEEQNEDTVEGLSGEDMTAEGKKTTAAAAIHTRAGKGGGYFSVWERHVAPFTYDPMQPYFSLVVPTKETVRLSFLLSKLIQARRSVFVTGSTGSGKTITITRLLEAQREAGKLHPVFLSFSARTKAEQTQQTIEAKLEKRRKNKLGPPAGRECVVFVDDVNLPVAEEFGAQPPIELLRQIQEFNGFYDRKKIHWKGLENTLLLLAAAPPSSGRKPLPQRFTRHSHAICMFDMEEYSVQKLFSSIVNGFFEWAKMSIMGHFHLLTESVSNICRSIHEDSFTEDLSCAREWSSPVLHTHLHCDDRVCNITHEAPTLLRSFNLRATHDMIYWTAQGVEPEVRLFSKSLIDATVELYVSVKENLLPTPSRPLYAFNFRNVKKVFQGVLAVHSRSLPDKESLARLWIHEFLRIFGDRLMAETERSWMKQQILALTARKFGLNWTEEDVFATPILWGNFLSPPSPASHPYAASSFPMSTSVAVARTTSSYAGNTTSAMSSATSSSSSPPTGGTCSSEGTLRRYYEEVKNRATLLPLLERFREECLAACLSAGREGGPATSTAAGDVGTNTGRSGSTVGMAETSTVGAAAAAATAAMAATTTDRGVGAAAAASIGSVIFFADAVEHLFRLCRMLMFGKEHALLVGVAGTGKQTLLRLAAFIQENQVVEFAATGFAGFCSGSSGGSRQTSRNDRGTADSSNKESAKKQQQQPRQQLREGAAGVLEVFRETEKRLLLATGLAEARPAVLLLNDTQVVCEGMLEDINVLLSTGEIPDLIDSDTLDMIYEDLAPVAKAVGRETGRDALLQLFYDRVAVNLHVVLCMSPVGDSLRNNLRLFPSLLSCCSVNFFDTWSKSALHEVAKNFFKTQQLEETKEDGPDTITTTEKDAKGAATGTATIAAASADWSLSEVPGISTRANNSGTATAAVAAATDARGECTAATTVVLAASHSPLSAQKMHTPALFRATMPAKGSNDRESRYADLCVRVHQQVVVTAGAFHKALRRPIYISPKHFIDLIGLVWKLSRARKEELRRQQSLLSRGLHKLNSTKEVIKHLTKELQQLEPDLQKKTLESEQLVQSVERDRAQAFGEQERVAAERKAVVEQQREVALVQGEAQREFEIALPALEAAISSLDALDKKDITELKSFTKPPPLVIATMEVVNLLLGEKMDWDTARKVLSDTALMNRLKNYDKDNIPAKVLKKLDLLLQRPDYAPEQVGKQSVAAMSLCMWTIAIQKYARVAKEVQPKREKLQEMNEKLNQANAQLEAAQEKLRGVMRKVQQMEDRLANLNEEKSRLVGDTQQCQQRLQRANILTSGLAEEAERWVATIAHLEEQLQYAEGDAFLSAACIAYCGPFTGQYRDCMQEAWQRYTREAGLLAAPTFAIAEVMSDPVELRDWNLHGLPSDRISVTSGVLVACAGRVQQRTPLCIDPQQQAKRWIVNKEAESNLRVVNLDHPKLQQILCAAVRLGQPVLIENAGETLPPLLDPLLTRPSSKPTTGGGPLRVRLGEHEVEVDERFLLFITTKLPNPHYLPEIALKVMLVNFTVTPDGLRQQLLAEVVRQEIPETEQRNTETLVQITKDKRALKQLEEVILQLLSESRGNILDDEKVVQALQQSRSTSQSVAARLRESEIVMKQVQAAREAYKAVAARGAALFFVTAELTAIDAMYQYSLSYFISVFNASIATTPPVSSEGEKEGENLQQQQRRIAALVQSITWHVFSNISRGLFESHKLIYAVLIAVEILKESRKEELLDPEAWSVFLRGVGNVGSAAEGELRLSNPLPTVLSDQEWKHVQALQSRLPLFRGLAKAMETHTEAWSQWISAEAPFKLPLPNGFGDAANNSLFQRLLLIKFIRSGQLVFGLKHLVEETMGQQYVDSLPPSLEEIYAASSSNTPILFILSPGVDPAFSLFRFAKEKGVPESEFRFLSLGRGQGPRASRLLENSMRDGGWVLLQNCHLATNWMPELEKVVMCLGENSQKEVCAPATAPAGGGGLQRPGETGVTSGGTATKATATSSSASASTSLSLNSSSSQNAEAIMGLSPDFRLFMTSMPVPYFPVPVLQNSLKVTVERPRGIRATLRKSILQLNAPPTTTPGVPPEEPNETWPRIRFALQLFHAVVQERQQFGSLGWNASYDFSDTDLEAAIIISHSIFDRKEKQEEFDLFTLQYTVSHIVYGGRVTDEWDRRCLENLLALYVSPEIFSEEEPLASVGLTGIPFGGTVAQLLRFADRLTAADRPEIFGLHPNAVLRLRKDQANILIQTILQIQIRDSATAAPPPPEEDPALQSAALMRQRLPDLLVVRFDNKVRSLNSSSRSGSAWGRPTAGTEHRPHGNHGRGSMNGSCKEARSQSVDRRGGSSSGADTEDAGREAQAEERNSMAVFLAQEAQRFNDLLHYIGESLHSLELASKGLISHTRELDDIYSALQNNQVPPHWAARAYPSLKPLAGWYEDLLLRVEFLRQWNEAEEPPHAFWLSGFFFPQGFLTAVLQDYARATRFPIDCLGFSCYVTQDTDVEIMKTKDMDMDGCYVYGLYLDGARWDAEAGVLDDQFPGATTSLFPIIHFQPSVQPEPREGDYLCPVYKTMSRAGILSSTGHSTNFVTSIELPTDQHPSKWVLRGTALICATED